MQFFQLGATIKTLVWKISSAGVAYFINKTDMNRLNLIKNACLAVALTLLATQSSQAGMNVRLYGAAGIGIGEAIGGTAVVNLYENDQFPDTVELYDFARSIPLFPGLGLIGSSTGFFEVPQPFATGDTGINDYGAVLDGLFIVPADGDYQFFVRSDDASALYITDSPLDLDSLKGEDRPAPDAQETGCCAGFEFGEPATEVYTWTAGSGKYLTMILKEGGGGDWAQLGISVNGGPIEVLSLGHVQRFEYFDDVPAEEGLSIAGFGPNRQPEEFGISVIEAQPVSVYVEFDKEMPSTDDIPDIVWEIDGVVQEGQKGSLLLFTATTDTSDEQFITRTVEATVEGFGSATFDVEVERDSTAPALLSAAGSGNPAGIIVNFSELVDPDTATDAANYELTGQDVTIESIEMLTGSSVLLKVSEYNTDPLTLAVSGVTDRAANPNTIADSSTPVAFTTKLMAFWDFNDDSNPQVAVDSASGIVGQVTNATYTFDGDGRSGEAGDLGMDFGADNSGTQHVFVEDASFLNISGASNQMSVSFWQRNVDTQNSSSFWMFSPSTNNGGRGNQAHVPWSNGQIYHDTAGCCNGGTERINRPTNQFEDWNDDFWTEWHHYTFIKNGDQKEIWIDGKLFHSGTNVEAFPSDFTSMTIGSATNGGNSVQAVMDDFAVFSLGLTSEEITALAEGGNPADLNAPLSAALTLASDLEDTTVLEGTTLSLTVGVEGGEPFTIAYQWFRDGEAIPGATGATYSIDKISRDVNGATFSVRAFNADGTYAPVASSEITVTVDQDLEAPVLVSATGSALNNSVSLVFNEDLDQESAEDTGNYAIDGLNVTGATLVNPTTVVLTTAAQDDAGANYTVQATGVKDQSEAGNESDTSTDFWSFELRRGGLSVLFYEDGGGQFTDFFPENRGIGMYPAGFAPYGTGVNIDDIRARRSTSTTYFEAPATGNINSTPPGNVIDNYALVVFGFIEPSQSGSYRFGIGTDDNSELYLSSDEDPNNTTLIANEPGWNAIRNYDNQGNQSEVISLEAGQRYYVEAIVAEGGGGDNLAVAWTFSDDDSVEPVELVNGDLPIPADVLWGYHPVQLDLMELATNPVDGTGFVSNDTSISASFRDGRSQILDTASVVVTVNGQVVDATVEKNDDGVTSVSAAPTLRKGTEYEVVVSYNLEGGGDARSVSFSFTTGGTPPPDCPQVSTAGLLNYWDFEGDADDKAGSLPGNASTNADNGTAGDGVSFVADGPAGSYGMFNGDNSTGVVEVPDSDDIVSTGRSLSIAAWFRVDSFDKNWQALIAHGESTDYRIAREGGNNNLAYNGGNGEPRGGGNVNDGRWHHVVAITEDGVASSLYIDGALADSRASDGIVSTETGRLLIGGNPGSGDSRSWNGAIDEVAMWSRVLTPYEIVSLANSGSIAAIAKDAPPPVPQPYFETILADGPIAFYRFEETEGMVAKNSGTMGEDADGLWMTGNAPADSIETDASFTDGPLPSGDFIGFAPDNKAASFTGLTDLLWIDTQNALLNGQAAFTLEYWVKPTNRIGTGWSRVGIVGQNDAVEYGFINTNTIQIWTPGGGALDTTYSFGDDEWHHVATVADGTGIKNYFDGILVGEGGSATGDYGSSDFNVHIGGGGVYDASGNHFEGAIDEVAIFNKAITPDRVALHYAAGAAGVYPGINCETGDAAITAVSAVDGNISIEFTGQLQSAPTVNGPWTDVTSTSPHSEAVADGAKFFRVIP